MTSKLKEISAGCLNVFCLFINFIVLLNSLQVLTKNMTDEIKFGIKHDEANSVGTTS